MALTKRDVILAAISSFVAWAIAVKLVPVLRYVGWAFAAGVTVTLLTITALVLSTSRGSALGQSRARASRSVAFVAPEAWKAEVAALSRRSTYNPAQLYPESSAVSDSLDGLLRLVLRDFVSSWYGNISRNPSFRNEIDGAVRLALINLRDRVLAVDLVEIGIARFVPIMTAHLKAFSEAERAVRGKHLNRNVTESEELDLAIAGKYNEGRLHPAAALTFSDTKLVQQQYLRRLVGRLIGDVLPESLTKSRSVSVLVREIMACAVLLPVMEMLSDPDTWNQLMEAYGRTMLQDRKTVRKLRAALDEHASPPAKLRSAMLFPRLTPRDNERQFERFIRAARQCNNLSDARRFRSEVASQLKKESQIPGQDQVYLRRLATGKRVLDQKVAMLAAGGGSNQPFAQRVSSDGGRPSRRENSTLADILNEASGLSYFMEYMDRQRLMSLVQFWIVVDGFRNPLEDDLAEQGQFPETQQKWTESDRADLAQINEAYLSKRELKISDESRSAVVTFLQAGRRATPVQYQRARIAILRAQTGVYEEMERYHYPNFKKSDLYYKYLTSDESMAAHPPLGPQRPSPTPSRASSRDPSKRAAPTPRVVPPRLSTADSSDLRRAAVSSTDLVSAAKSAERGPQARRSLDLSPSKPLFDDDYDNDPLSRSTQSLDTDLNTSPQITGPDDQIVEAMEAALNNIMEDEPSLEDSRASLLGSAPSSIKSPRLENDSPRSSIDFSRADSIMSAKDKEKPSIASLGLVNTSSRIGVFSDDDLFADEEEKYLSDEHDDPEDSDAKKEDDDEIHEAAPGDLGLAEAIAALSSDIERLAAQDSVVDSLLRKAELTNNSAELRILRKSKASLEREMHRKELQRQQYIVQESDNSLFGRSTIDIKNIMVGAEDDGREYALYVIEVQRKAGEKMPAATWAIARRYSEFHDLHQRLRSKYPSVRHLDFPRRRVMMKLQREFLHKRRLSLERYLRELLQLPDVCRSRELRAFLSQQAIIAKEDGNPSERGDIVSRIYNSVADGMEDFLGNIPVIDQLSIAGQNLISAATAATSQLNTMPNGILEDTLTSAEAEAELNAFENRELEPFVKPICDIFLETFELNKGNNWLRGRAVVVVLHQLLGGTIERKVRENAKGLVQEESLCKYVDFIKETMWPGGGARRESTARTMSEKAKSRREASLVLATLIPDLASSVVGRANAQAASRRIFATLNNQRLNAHLAFTLLDEIVQVLFGDIVMR